LSEPVHYFATEGRSYASALCLVFVASWYAALAISGLPNQLNSKRAAAVGSLAALIHVYAALFCGCLAAGLLALAFFLRRRDLLQPGLVLGLSASIVFATWLIIGIHSVDRISWLIHSTWSVLVAAVFATTLAFGVPVNSLGAVLAVAMLTIALMLAIFGLLIAKSRALFTAFIIAISLFIFLPIMASFLRPIIFGRYWAIGSPALPVLLVFAIKIWFFGGSDRYSRALCAAATALYVLTVILGSSNGRANTKPFWNGAGVTKPLLRNCQGATVHVYFGKPTNVESFAGIWSFQYLTGALSTKFKDAQLETTPYLAAENSSCDVLGWAEHAFGWQRLSEKDLLKLMKIQASPNEVEIARHATGFVILKRPA
jgi:hypothetical protein